MSGVDAYTRALNHTGSSRNTEFRLLAQVTKALMQAKEIETEARSDPEKMALFSDALTWNKQVWDAFVEDCGTEGNQLPKETRAAIVSLGIWVTKETMLGLSGDGDLDSLIAVNRDLMKGLQSASKSQPDAEETALSEAAARRRTSIIDLA